MSEILHDVVGARTVSRSKIAGNPAAGPCLDPGKVNIGDQQVDMALNAFMRPGRQLAAPKGTGRSADSIGREGLR